MSKIDPRGRLSGGGVASRGIPAETRGLNARTGRWRRLQRKQETATILGRISTADFPSALDVDPASRVLVVGVPGTVSERTRAMDKTAFRYQPTCSAPHCEAQAVYKVAAPWSNGTSRELKNYGLACDAHRDSLLALAQIHRQGLKLAEGETIGPVGLYQLTAGQRDAELTRLPDH